MQLPKVSILIISYNQINFIREALDGAVNQDYPNLEVVVSDDGSTDGPAEIIEEYQRRFPHILVALLNRVNSGITANSNIGLRKCSGKYIAFSYGDDVLMPGKVAAQVGWFEADPTRVLCGHRVEVFSETDSARHVEPRLLRRGNGANLLIRMGNLFPATSVMVRSKCIPVHGFEPSVPTVTDYIMFIEVLAHGGKFGYVDGLYARYRRHPNNVTNKRLKILEDVEKTLGIVKVRYPHLSKSCNIAMSKHVIYERAMTNVMLGRYRIGRQQLWSVFMGGSFNVRAFINYFKTFFSQMGAILNNWIVR